MALKNKDGSIYKLSSPNPIMKTQETWRDFALHNMNNINKLVIPDDKKTIRKIFHTVVEQSVKTKEQEFIEEIVRPVPVEKPVISPIIETSSDNKIVIEDKPQPKTSINMTESIKVTDTLMEKKTDFICLESIFHETFDELYNERRRRITYGDQFTFEGFLLQEEDFVIEFWARKRIQEHSVVFPKNLQKRWWKINKVEEKTGGFLHQAVISDFNPDLT